MSSSHSYLQTQSASQVMTTTQENSFDLGDVAKEVGKLFVTGRTCVLPSYVGLCHRCMGRTAAEDGGTDFSMEGKGKG